MGAMPYRRTTPFSYSRFDLFETCPAAFRMKYVDKKLEAPSRPLMLGSFIHEVLKHYTAHLYGNRVETDITSLPIIADRLFFAKPTGLNGNDLDEIKDILGRYAETHILDLRTYAGAEEMMRWDIDENRTVWAVIDRLHIDGDIATIIDYKTDHQVRPESEVARDVQLAIYCWMVYKQFPQVSRFKVCLDFVRHGIVRWIPGTQGEYLDLTVVEKAEGYINGMIQQIEAEKKWAPRPGAGCAWCQFIDQCPAMAVAAGTASGDGALVIATPEQAADAANKLAVLDAQVSRLKAGMKAFCNANGPLESNGLRWGFERVPSMGIEDVAGFVHACREAGHDPLPLLRVDSDELKKATRHDDGLAAVADDWLIDRSYTRFGYKKLKGGDE